jgi:arylsulfatase
MAELAGAPIDRRWNGEEPPQLPGRSLRGVLNRDAEIPRHFLYFHHIGHRAIRVGEWKLVAMARGPWELYDMRTDRSEMHDLAASRPDLVQSMAARWQACEDEFRKQAGPLDEKPA